MLRGPRNFGAGVAAKSCAGTDGAATTGAGGASTTTGWVATGPDTAVSPIGVRIASSRSSCPGVSGLRRRSAQSAATTMTITANQSQNGISLPVTGAVTVGCEVGVGSGVGTSDNGGSTDCGAGTGATAPAAGVAPRSGVGLATAGGGVAGSDTGARDLSVSALRVPSGTVATDRAAGCSTERSVTRVRDTRGVGVVAGRTILGAAGTGMALISAACAFGACKPSRPRTGADCGADCGAPDCA